jgi:hypothetical protein
MLGGPVNSPASDELVMNGTTPNSAFPVGLSGSRRCHRHSADQSWEARDQRVGVVVAGAGGVLVGGAGTSTPGGTSPT